MSHARIGFPERCAASAMERVGRLIARLKSKSALQPDELVVAAWPAAVGKRLATRTRVAGFRDGTVTVEVEDELWQRNLAGLKGQILANMSRLTGLDLARDIRFTLAVPKRPPIREEQLPAWSAQTRKKARA